MEVMLDGGRLRFGERLSVSLHRTLRIPEDGRTYPLPPGFGLFPIRLSRSEGAGAATRLLVPMYQREALWLGFSAAPWKPNALKVICGGINAVSGVADEGTGLREPQDYLVCPNQPWLDGFNAGDGVIRQFVAMPLGQGYAIEAAGGGPERGGIAIIAFEPKPGRFPDEPPPARPGPVRFSRPIETEPREMALGAGGRMRQKIYPDPHGRDPAPRQPKLARARRRGTAADADRCRGVHQGRPSLVRAVRRARRNGGAGRAAAHQDHRRARR
jgi:hypothetical protein